MFRSSGWLNSSKAANICQWVVYARLQEKLCSQLLKHVISTVGVVWCKLFTVENWSTFFFSSFFSTIYSQPQLIVIRFYFISKVKVKNPQFYAVLFFDNEKTLKKFHDILQHSTVVPPVSKGRRRHRERDCVKTANWLESESAECNCTSTMLRVWVATASQQSHVNTS